MAEKAESLRVQALLSGSLQEQQGRTRATLTLTYADGFELWSESVQADAGDPFALQQTIVQTVLQALGEPSQPGQEPAGPDFGTEDPEAYRLGTLGRQLARQVSNVNAVTKATGLIEQALAIDPSFYELYPVLLAAKATVGLHKNTISTFRGEIDTVVQKAKQAGAPREIVLKLSLMQAESRADLFEVERLSRELLSIQGQQEWDPLEGVSGPIFNYGLLLAMAGYYEDAEAYWRSLLPTANSFDQQVFLEKKLLELELVAGNFGSVIGALGNCTDEAARALAPRGRCLPRLMRAQLGAGLADAALETARLHPNPGVSEYMIAVVNQDRQVLAAAVANTPPENWMTYYRLLLDNEQSDQAFEFWRNRFPFGGRHFLWDTIFMETAEHPYLWQDEGFLGLLYYYGMTPSWRRNICEGAQKAAEFTGIVPSCKRSPAES
jgi:tetratricopeptide (TPR) repeat protein